MLPLAAIPVVGPFLAMVPTFIWKWAGIGLLGVSLVGYGFVKGETRANAKCEAEKAESRRLAEKQDNKASDFIAQNQKNTIDFLSTQKALDDAAIAKLRAEIAKRPVAARCGATASDVRSLR